MSNKTKIIIGTIVLIFSIIAIIAIIFNTVHQYSEWIITKSATCTEAGEETRYCFCGRIQTRVIAPKDHSYNEWTAKEAATCTKVGEEVRYCSCGDMQIRSVGIKEHAYSDWVVIKAATCTETGEEAKYCSCGDTQTKIISIKGHSYNDWAVTKAATCTKAGEETRTCSCGDIQTNSIAAMGHSYGEWIIAKEATCAKTGEKYKTCSVCNDKQTESIPKSSDHTYNKGTTTKSPTCTKSGIKLFLCTVCTNTKEEPISPLGHSVTNTGICTKCGLATLGMTDTEIEDSKTVTTLSTTVTEYSFEIDINITLKNDKSYSKHVPVYVDVKIEDGKGNIVYKKTIIKKSSQSTITIDYDEITNSFTNTGIIYYTVYNDYFSFETRNYALEKIPWTVTIDLPNVPQIISKNGYNESTCNVTKITYKVNDDDVTFYFTGDKTYDKKGDYFSQNCYIGWKLYDEDGYVIANGICYTTAVHVGEKFKDSASSAYNVIEQGKTYRLVILDVQ